MKIRASKKEDFSGILAICDGVFDDFDVFPYLFTRYIDAPNRTCSVAEDENGHIVACDASIVLDNGTTYVSEAERTAQHAKGTGIQHMLRMNTYTETKKKFPNIRNFVRVATIHTDFVNARKGPLVNPLFIQKLLIFADAITPARLGKITCPDNLDLLGRQLPLDKLELISPEQFRILLSSKASCQHLFPHDMICVHSEMFELLDGNINEIYHGRGNTQVIGMPSLQHRAHYDDGVLYNSLSFGLALMSKKGWAVDFVYYGRDNIDEVKAHVMKQLCLMKDVKGRDVYIAFTFHKGILCDATVNGLVDFMKKEVFLTNTKWEVVDQNFLSIKLDPRYSSAANL